MVLAALGGCSATQVEVSLSLPSSPHRVEGTLAADEVWEGEVEIVDDLLVPRGVTLRIRPGTTVRVRTADTSRTEPEFLDNATELLVRGRLLAEGTAEARILFEPSEKGEESRWAGILFDGGEGSIIRTGISGAETGVLLLDASPLLADVEITGVRHGIMIGGGSRPRLERVTVDAREGGIYCWEGSAPELLGVNARGTEREGLLVAPGASPLIEGSTFAGSLAGVLWAAGEPPPELAERSPVAAGSWRKTALPQVEEAPPLREPEEGGGGKPRLYRGESFIGRDESWEGEVHVDGTVMVAPGATLTLRAGTTVRFAFRDTDGDGIGESEIFVQGRLVAAGEAARPVTFTALERQGPGRWGAVNIMGSDAEENLLSYSIVESSYRGLHSHFSSFRVEHSLFRNNYRGLQFQESTAVVRDSLLRDNVNGLRFRDSTVVVENCRILGNRSGLQTLRSRFTLSGSTIAGNALAGIHLRETDGTIEGNRVTDNLPGLRATGGRLRLEGNTFAANRFGGVQLRESTLEVSGNSFAGNIGNGLFIDSPAARLRTNSFSGNLRFALENNSTFPVDAVGNHWGVERAGIPRVLFDEGDDPRLGPVNYDPPLDSPPRLP